MFVKREMKSCHKCWELFLTNSNLTFSIHPLLLYTHNYIVQLQTQAFLKTFISFTHTWINITQSVQPKHFQGLDTSRKVLSKGFIHKGCSSVFDSRHNLTRSTSNLWLSLAYLNSPFIPWCNFKRLHSPRLRVFESENEFFLIFPCLIGSAAHMHYNYKITAIAHMPDAGCFWGLGSCSTCLLMTPASPPEPKTRQGKQARVMTLSGPITQDALSIFIPHHSHIILINHLPYKLWTRSIHVIEWCWMKLK